MVITKELLEEKISNTMVGRDRETGRFKEQFDRVLEGGMGLTVVSGAPGVGKTFFVEHAVSLLGGAGATYVHGKFRQYDDKPLVAFSEVIEQSVKHILTLPAESLNRIKSNLNQKLGGDAAIIASLCPFAQILLGAHKSVHTDNLEQLKYRVRKAVYQFLAAVSTALFPLIVFLDDLQWADAPSVSIIEAICQDYEFLNMHLVLAWRNGDDSPVKLTKLPKREDILIGLEKLEYEDIDRYIRLVFGEAMEHKDYLVRMLYGLTLGNPFDISRILQLFLRENVIQYSAPETKWISHHNKMASLNLPADTQRLLTKQIEDLEKEERELLQLIACCGESGVDFLRALTGAEEDVLNARLHRLCENAMLVKTVRDSLPQSEMRYGLIHDIVLKLAYDSLTPEEKSKLHHHIAVTLSGLQNRPVTADDRLILASHLLRTDISLLRRDGTEQWIAELYEAGLAAKQTAAIERALELFERCAELLDGYEPNAKSGLALKINLELAECAFICGRVEEAKEQFDALLKNHPEPADQLTIKRRYIALCACNGDFEQVMETGTQILGYLNFRLDPKQLRLDLIRSRLLIGNRKISRLEHAPAITDPRLLCILETLTVMVLAANRISDSLSALYSLKLAAVSARYGNSPYAPVAYAAYCQVLFYTFHDHKTGRRLEETVLGLIEDCQSHDLRATALFILGAFTHHWTSTLEASVCCLERSIAEGEKEGTSLYGSYAIAFTVITRYMMGRPLEELEQYIEDCRRKPKRLEHYVALFIWDIYEDHIARLRQGSAPEREAPPGDGGHYGDKKLFANTMKLTGDIVRLEWLYLEGRTEEAYRLTVSLAPIIASIQGFLLDVEYIFYSILARLAMHSRLSGAERRINRLAIKKHLNELAYCVRVNKSNHYARYLLARAEYDAVFAQGRSAEKLCREAMDFAEKQGNLPLEALANLFAARYHREDRKLAKFYATDAADLYRKWGAAHIADLVAGEMGLEAPEAASSETPAPSAGAGEPGDDESTGPDILFHLNEMEKLDGDGKYLYLLDLLVRRGDADYCAVFFEKSDEMYLKYERRKGEEGRVYPEAINMNHLSSLPHKIIRYVARTGTEILMDRGDRSEFFTNDSYLADRNAPSLVCLPIKYSGVPVGIIYLEKAGGSLDRDNLPPFVKGLLSSISSTQTGIKEMGRPGAPESRNARHLFTERELEILKLVAAGKSNTEIGGELFITSGTVKNHLKNIYGKLDVDNRVKAVMKARELKIIRL